MKKKDIEHILEAFDMIDDRYILEADDQIGRAHV